MQTQDLKRIRFVTRHYRDMNGLQRVALGLFPFSLGLTLTLSKALGFLSLALQLALIVGAFVLLRLGRSYYLKTFGDIEPRQLSTAQRTWAILLGALGAVLLLQLLFYRSGIEWRLTYLLFGGLFVGTWIWRECRLSQAYYLALGAPLIAFAVAGSSWTASFPSLATAGSSQLLAGMAQILAGLFDHWQLVSVLKPLPTTFHEESEDAETVGAQR